MLPAGNKFGEQAGPAAAVLRSAGTNDGARHYWLHVLFFMGFRMWLITGDYASLV